MTPFIAIVAAISTTTVPTQSLGLPVSEAELASTVAGPTMLIASPTARVASFGLDPLPTGDEIDCWWAYDGTALIAEAVEPTPTMPAGFDLSQVGAGVFSLHINMVVSAETRP